MRPTYAQVGWAMYSDITVGDAVIHVYNAGGNLIETHEHKSEFKEP